MSDVRIVGRSSSHFTRVVRLFAHEFEVPYVLQVVPDLMAATPEAYGGNPGLKVPNLITDEGVVFGALNSCRTISELSTKPRRVVWPEHVRTPLAANAQELILQAMATEVTWVLSAAAGAGESSYASKLRVALLQILAWLDAHVCDALTELPQRDFSYLEFCLFCLMEHLEFREVLPIDPYPSLGRIRTEWAQRASACVTRFHFDV